MKRKPKQGRVIKTCEYCKESFSVKFSHAATTEFCNASCRASGLRRRRQKEIEYQFGKPIKDLLTELYHESKLGIKKIAKTIGVSDRNLWGWFESLGIERRSKSDAVANQWVGNDERKEKTGDALSKRIRAYYDSGGISPSKRPEVAAKISEAKKGEKNWMYNRFGALNPTWKGGKITYRGKGWRGIMEQVRRRDSYKCRRCGATKGLQVHHITPYRETQDNSLDNLVTLCWSCHMAVEHRGATWD